MLPNKLPECVNNVYFCVLAEVVFALKYKPIDGMVIAAIRVKRIAKDFSNLK